MPAEVRSIIEGAAVVHSAEVIEVEAPNEAVADPEIREKPAELEIRETPAVAEVSETPLDLRARATEILLAIAERRMK
jgi:hypothetical protein